MLSTIHALPPSRYESISLVEPGIATILKLAEPSNRWTSWRLAVDRSASTIASGMSFTSVVAA
jgi:hypothetical protein